MDFDPASSTISFDAEVEGAVKDALKDSSEFDAPDFDAVAYLNRLFPDQQSLAELDACDADLRIKIAETRHGLVSAVRQQAGKSFRAEDDLDYARDAVVALFEFAREVKARADASEEMIERVCRDIRALDDAKRNLHDSILILSNLKNLTVQLQALTESVNQRKYSRARFDLVACRDLLARFSAHQHLDRVREMHRLYQNAADDAEKDILATYTGLAPMATPAPPGLRDAALAIDAIGEKSVDRFVKAFVRYQANTYNTIYGGDVHMPPGRYTPEGEGALSRTDKRYTWIKRLLHAIDESYAAAFPATWHLQQELCMELCVLTHNHFVARLPDDPTVLPSGDRDAYASDVVRAVRLTLDFERYLTRKFKKATGEGGADGGDPTAGDELQTLTLHERMRAKYGPSGAPPASPSPQGVRGAGSAADALALSNTGSRVGEKPPELKVYRFYRIITSAFDLHLEAFVSFEKQRLHEALTQQLANEERWVVESPPTGATFASARDLFVMIHEAYKRATKLTSREPLARMFEVWVELVKVYSSAVQKAVSEVVAESVDHTRPEAAAARGGAGATAAAPGGGVAQRQSYVIHDSSDSACVRVALAANSLEFVAHSLRTVATETKEVAVTYVKQYIDCDATVDAIVAQTYRMRSKLAALLSVSVEKAVAPLAKHKWDLVNEVAEPSMWVSNTTHAMIDFFRTVGGVLSTSQLRPLCDRAAGVVATTVLREIHSIKYITSKGAAQLEVDVQALRSSVCDLPEQSSTREDVPFHFATASRFSSAQTAAYVKTVAREFASLDILLQCLRLPQNEQFLDAYVGVAGESVSAWHLSKVLDLRGIAKVRAQTLCEQLSTKYGVGVGAVPTPADDDNAISTTVQSLRERLRGGIGGGTREGGKGASVLERMKGSEVMAFSTTVSLVSLPSLVSGCAFCQSISFSLLDLSPVQPFCIVVDLHLLCFNLLHDSLGNVFDRDR